MLRERLVVRGMAASRDGAGLRLTLTLANAGDAPLQLSRADLALTQGDAPVALPDVPELAAPLSPGEERTVAPWPAAPARCRRRAISDRLVALKGGGAPAAPGREGPAPPTQCSRQPVPPPA